LGECEIDMLPTGDPDNEDFLGEAPTEQQKTEE
jgi:hypothetical protein